MKRLLTIAVVVVLGASPVLAETKAPPKAEEVAPADAERVLEFFNRFADTIITNKDDCKKMAGAVNVFVDANGDNIKKAREIKDGKKRLPKAIEEKMMARLKEMVPAMQKCQRDPDVRKALERAKGEDKPANK
ncbi:MAG: hypothetical protein WKG01_32960 [Kofleriaceae bacterium]